MDLRPPNNLHRAVMHTTCDVKGGYTSDDIHLDVAFPQMGNDNDDIFKRHGTFYASFEMDNEQRIGSLRARSGCHWMGRIIADLLCLRFGKSVEFLGFVYSNGQFMQPRSPHYPIPSMVGNQHPFVSGKPRVDYSQVIAGREDHPDPFNLAAADLIMWVIENPPVPESRALIACLSAVHFYAEALRTFKDQPDYAYLSLVTAGEVFTGALEVDIDAFLDDGAKALLLRIHNACGARDANEVRKRLYASTARFVGALAGPLDDSFFERTEARKGAMKVGRIKRDTISAALRASYAVRSKLSHAGMRPAPWINPGQLDEMPMGTPYLPGEDVDEWVRALSMCLTHLGLERVIRYALLKTLLGLKPPASLPPPSPAD